MLGMSAMEGQFKLKTVRSWRLCQHRVLSKCFLSLPTRETSSNWASETFVSFCCSCVGDGGGGTGVIETSFLICG